MGRRAEREGEGSGGGDGMVMDFEQEGGGKTQGSSNYSDCSGRDLLVFLCERRGPFIASSGLLCVCVCKH